MFAFAFGCLNLLDSNYEWAPGHSINFIGFQRRLPRFVKMAL